jgi:hypothetical protein
LIDYPIATVAMTHDDRSDARIVVVDVVSTADGLVVFIVLLVVLVVEYAALDVVPHRRRRQRRDASHGDVERYASSRRM